MLRSYTKPTVALARASVTSRSIYTHPSFKLSDPSLLVSTGWVNGRPLEAQSGDTYNLTDPATNQTWHSMADLGVHETEQAIQAAHDAFPAFSAIPARTRGRMIMEMDRLFLQAKDDLAQIAVMECGKTLQEALGELGAASSVSWLMAGEAERNIGETIKGVEADNMRYFTIREPVGPAALLSPWNFPIFLPWRKLVSALAAGCTVVMKPSPETPVTTAAMALIAQRAGVPDGVVNVVTSSVKGTPKVGKVLCEDKRIKKMHFTGSTPVGKLLAHQCAGTLKKMTLELGGNGAFIVFEDADLDQAATLLVANKFRNAGQVCVSANRVYVHRSIHDQFAKIVEQKVRALRIGHGLDKGTTTGSLATQRGVERCVRLVEDAKRKGATVVTGGNRVGEGWHFEPTLLVGAGRDAIVHREEMFAPILSMYAFDSEDEVVRLANDTDMGLTNYVQTQNVSRAWRMFEALKSGQVAINTGNATSSEMPFGGIKASGMGKEGGYGYGIQDFCNVRTAALML